MADETQNTTAEQNPKFRTKHPLQNAWTVWYDNPGKRVSQNNWSEFVKQLNSFHTVEDFWCLYNNIVPPTKLLLGSNYHMFKRGIEPKWEDQANQRGGKWTLVVPKNQNHMLDEYWLRLILSLVGENYDDGDEVCGCVASVRKAQDKLALWVANADNADAVLRIGKTMRQHLELPANLTLGFQVHADAMKQNSSYNNPNKYEV